MNAAEIEKRQVLRFRVLSLCYEHGLKQKFNLTEIAYENGIKNGNLDEAIAYLHEEGLITSRNSKGIAAEVTHQGKKIYEYIITNPDKRTDLFPPYNEMGI